MIELTADRLRGLLEYDPVSGIFRWRCNRRNSIKAGMVAGTLRPDGYLQIKIDGRNYQGHRLAWLYVHGVWPREEIDHKNRKRADNPFSNLRDVTNAQQKYNQSVKCTSKSGVRGVDFRLGKWRAQIRLGGRRVHLGLYGTVDAAAAAYDQADKVRLLELSCGAAT